MTKHELIKEIKDVVGDDKLTTQQVEKVYDAVLDCICSKTVKEGRIALSDLGVFSVKTKNARNGVNPRTGEKIQIPERKKIQFKPSKSFQAYVETGKKAKEVKEEKAKETKEAKEEQPKKKPGRKPGRKPKDQK